MRRLRPPTLLLLIAAVAQALGGCAPSANGSRGSTSGPIVQAQVEASTARNAYELVQQLRPTWLRARGTQSIQNPGSTFPVVYVNGTREGSIEALRTVEIALVREVEFLSAPQATTRFGTGHSGGAILVHFRR
jgi:hypothetical protein